MRTVLIVDDDSEAVMKLLEDNGYEFTNVPYNYTIEEKEDQVVINCKEVGK